MCNTKSLSNNVEEKKKCAKKISRMISLIKSEKTGNRIVREPIHRW